MSGTPRQQIHVLHVDDEPDFADLTKTFLEQGDDQFTVETATSADDGLRKFHERPPDCIVSDYNMPGTDGLEFLQTVRDEYPDFPFILFTGKGTEEVASDAISAGATDYLKKRSGTDQYSLLANRILNAVTQHRSEKRLRETREEYGAVFENAKNGLLLVDVQNNGFRYEQCNPRAAELIGRDKTDIVGRTPREALGPENGQKVVGAYRTCIRQRESVEYTVTLDLPMGQVSRKCEVSPIESNGKLTQLVVVFQDITKERDRQRDLEKVETLFQHAQDSLFLIDVDDEFVIERVNPGYEDATGVSVSEIRGQTPTQLLGEEQGTTVETRYRECVERRKPLQYIEQLQFGSEPSYWETRIAPVIVEDTVEYIAGSTRNITDRERRKTELQEYETIIEALNDAVYVLDDEGQFTYVNDEFVEMVGYERDTILGSDSPLIKSESAVQTAKEHLGQLLSNDGPDDATFEVAIQPCEGDPIVCEDHIGVLPYEGDNFEGSVGTLRDITPAKERERQLEQQNDLFKRAQEIAAVGAWSYDVRTDEAFLTDKAYDIHGLSPADELGPEKSLSFYHPDDQPVIRDAFDQAIERGESYDLELRLIDAAGTLRWVRTRGAPEIEDGSVVRVRGTLQDITEREQQQRELEDRTAELETLTTELEEQYRHLFEEAPVMAVVTRAKQGRPIIEDCNDLFVETLGYEKSEVVGGELEEFYTAESQHRLLEEEGYERALSGEFARENRELVTADGETVETLLRAVPREDTREDSRGTLAFYIDISERKRLERQRNRLEEFTSIVSHDLRSPLTVADGQIELAKKECNSDHLTRAAKAIDRSQALIDDLLTLAREGDEVTGRESVALGDVAQTSWETVETRQATLETDATGRIQADRSRLQQLFENLYRNAAEHGGDRVTVHIGDLDGGFYVADTGSGIPESDRDEVFEAEYSTSDEGTGFGLRIVEQIAEAHGWDTAVTESEQGGARFEFTGVELVD